MFGNKEFIDTQGLRHLTTNNDSWTEANDLLALIETYKLANESKRNLYFWECPLLKFIDDVFMIGTKKWFHAEVYYFWTTIIHFKGKDI